MFIRPSTRAWSGVAALAACCISAHAQSTATVSGFLDVGAYRGFDKVKRVGTIQRSNIAYSGSEDLGGGLAATFKLSHRLDLDTGTSEGAYPARSLRRNGSLSQPSFGPRLMGWSRQYASGHRWRKMASSSSAGQWARTG